MRSHRLDRLARLTQGAALVGLGLLDSGCKKEPSEQIHINATATPPTVTTPPMNAPYIPPSATPTDSAAAPSATPSATAAAPSATPTAKARTAPTEGPAHPVVNSPNRPPPRPATP